MNARYPEAEIHWVVARNFSSILQNHPMIHKLWIIDKDDWKQPGKLLKTFRDLNAVAEGLRKERFDLVVDLQGLLRSGVIAAFSGAGHRIGFEEAREGSRYFYTRRIRGGRDIHAVDRYLRIARELDCPPAPPAFPFPPLPEQTPVLDALPEIFAVLAPSAGGGAKRWPPQRFGELAARLPFPSYVVAGKADAETAGEVVLASGGKAVSLAGKTGLPELAAVLRRSRFLVCNDTGPMHIAAALSVPVFAVFGPTDPARTGPYGNGHTIIRAGLSCSPCYKRKPCRDWQCMEAVSADDVFRAISGRIPL